MGDNFGSAIHCHEVAIVSDTKIAFISSIRSKRIFGL